MLALTRLQQRRQFRSSVTIYVASMGTFVALSDLAGGATAWLNLGGARALAIDIARE